MFCSKQTTVFALAAALFILIPLVSSAGQPREVNQTQTNLSVNLRWGSRPGVARYRLQLAQDRDFADIVFDRVITGNQTQVNDLAPGRYFWRVAPLTAKLGEFSSAGVVDVARAAEPLRNPSPVPTPASISSPPRNPPTNSIVASGGWRAAIGDVGSPVLAHLRSPDRWYVVTTSSDGVTYALDAANGVALWSVRSAPQTSGATGSVPGSPIIVPAPSHLDDVVLISSSSLVRLEGSTGRELWRATLPAFISSAIVVGERSSTNIIVTDTSLQRLLFLNSLDGNITSQIKLPGRIVGTPTALDDFAHGAFVLAYENGQIEIRDSGGALIRSGSAASRATTPAIMVRGRRGNLVLVGTRDGLTALTADTLQPLGRVALDNDQSRGNLTAQDLDGDGIVEVLMTTVRGHVVVVNTADGKIIWDVAARNDNGTFAFADLNRDGVIDVFTSDGPSLVALSGRDGSVIWRDTETSSVIANHTTAFSSRALTALPSISGAVVLVNEPARGGLRAITFPPAGVRPLSR